MGGVALALDTTSLNSASNEMLCNVTTAQAEVSTCGVAEL
jgi:hypothetical protein